jgi:hypothetical protein
MIVDPASVPLWYAVCPQRSVATRRKVREVSSQQVPTHDIVAQAHLASDHLNQSVIGTWRLVAWEAHTNGTVTRPFGDNPVGYITYTADGYVFVQIMRPGSRNFVDNGQFGRTAEEMMRALGFGAYGGTYEVQDGVVVHHIEVSLFPDWPGADRRRTLEWDGDRLVLTTLPTDADGATRFSRLTWKRAVSG